MSIPLHKFTDEDGDYLIFNRDTGLLLVASAAAMVAAVQLTPKAASNLASALLQFATRAEPEPEIETEKFDPKKHLWGIDAAWEPTSYPQPTVETNPRLFAKVLGEFPADEPHRPVEAELIDIFDGISPDDRQLLLTLHQTALAVMSVQARENLRDSIVNTVADHGRKTAANPIPTEGLAA